MNFLSPDRLTPACAKQSGDGVRTARASYEPSSSRPVVMPTIGLVEGED